MSSKLVGYVCAIHAGRRAVLSKPGLEALITMTTAGSSLNRLT